VPKLVAMSADVASGLSYLQCVNYVHTDIAARNCMVTDDLCVKIGGKKNAQKNAINHFFVWGNCVFTTARP